MALHRLLAHFSQEAEIKIFSTSIPHLEEGKELEGFLLDVELFYLLLMVSWKASRFDGFCFECLIGGPLISVHFCPCVSARQALLICTFLLSS
jgi:hypothetical protein